MTGNGRKLPVRYGVQFLWPILGKNPEAGRRRTRMEVTDMRAIRKIRMLLLALLIAALPAISFAGVFVSITVAPPVLPVYTQPVCPGDGYLWTPGYWAYGP
ncbi:MAG TPA: hypothetical protein VGM27_24295, partial [Acidobacteriaceae bacterium]